MNTTITLAALVCLCTVMGGISVGDEKNDPFVRHSITVGGQEYRYAVYRPEGLDREAPARGLVFLHGMGECGTDGEKSLRVGLPPAIRKNPERWPFVVLVPQKPIAQSEWEDHEEALLAMMDRVFKEENVHPGRVAITGLSQGGHGTIAMVARHPERFRAAAPVCGYVQPWWDGGERVESRGETVRIEDAALIKGFSTTPVWLFHGKKDDVIPVIESERLHALLTDAELDSTLTIFPNDNHNSWDSAYGKEGLARWLAEMTE